MEHDINTICFSGQDHPIGRTTTRPVRNTNPVQRLGNFKSYAAAAANKHDNDNPTYKQALAGPDKDKWIVVMQSEYESFAQLRVGRLIDRPNDVNVLGGMWRLKRKCDTAGQITAYKARWVILGNRQIHGVDYLHTYASVGIKESLHTLYALIASEDLEWASFDIKTAFLTGTTDITRHTQSGCSALTKPSG